MKNVPVSLTREDHVLFPPHQNLWKISLNYWNEKTKIQRATAWDPNINFVHTISPYEVTHS